jgi:hypothetical protein
MGNTIWWKRGEQEDIKKGEKQETKLQLCGSCSLK